MFAYCNNNPAAYIDATGTKRVSILTEIKYDVPLFDQGTTSLCWAYSQAMIESYEQGGNHTQEWADKRARLLGETKNGLLLWNKGNWPTNLGESHNVNNAEELFDLLAKNGPMYALYTNGAKKRSEKEMHLVVITGVDRSTNKVYTNNSWGGSDVQSFSDFRAGLISSGDQWNGMFLYAVYSVN